MRTFFIVIFVFVLMVGPALAAGIDGDGNLTATEFVETGFDPTTQLKGSWYLDGNLTDSSGLGNNGTVAGAPTVTADRFGAAGRAMSFNGSSDAFHSSGNVGISSKTASVSLWFKTPTFSATSIKMLVELSPDINSYLNTFYISYNHVLKGNVLATMRSSLGLSAIQTTSSRYDDNNWHHLVVVFDKNQTTALGQTKIYVDGILPTNEIYSTYNKVHTSSFADNKIYIASRGDSSLFFNGSMDEVKVFNRALSADEVFAMYNTENDPAKFRKADDGTFSAPWFVEGDTALSVQMRGKKESLTIKGSLIESP